MIYFLLILVGLLLTVIMLPFAISFKIFASILRLNFNVLWFKRIALSIDQFNNVVCDDLFNFLLIKRVAINRFGSEDETISSVIGKNYLAGTLTFFGYILRYTLHVLDPNHSVRSIEKSIMDTEDVIDDNSEH